MKKVFALFTALLFLPNITGCNNRTENQNADSSVFLESEVSSENTVVSDNFLGNSTEKHSEPSVKYEILTEITVNTSNGQFDGVLYDNYTAREFAKLLPITSDLWDLAESFAKAINLNDKLVTPNEVTREYEPGGLAYCTQGSSVAFFYNDNYAETLAPVIPIGKINNISGFNKCSGSITITEKFAALDNNKFDTISENTPVTETEVSNSDSNSENSFPESEPAWESVPGSSNENLNESSGESISEQSKSEHNIPEQIEPQTPVINGDTVLTAAANPRNSQTLYIWEADNMPATTEYTRNDGGYTDDPDFRPYIVSFPVQEGTKIKGAVLVCAGGILAGEMLLNFDGTVNGTILDASYRPDSLDTVSADAGACGMIYSFYGRLSVASDDVEKFKSSDLPPTYFCYGTRDPYVSQFEKCIAALRKADVTVADNVLNNRPHGYGYTQGWIPDYDEWLSNVFLRQHLTIND